MKLSYYIHVKLDVNIVLVIEHMICVVAAENATLLEHVILTVVIGIPIIGASMMGYGSGSLVYSYVLIFDFLRCLGHCNVEIVPHKLFEAFPFLRYVIYTPT